MSRRLTSFSRAKGLIVVGARVWGRIGVRDLRLVFDTGSTETLIKPEVLEGVGYDGGDVLYRTAITSAIGKEPGLMVRVSKFWALGFQAIGDRVHAHDLPYDDIDGLLGLRFLNALDYTIYTSRSEIEAWPRAKRG